MSPARRPRPTRAARPAGVRTHDRAEVVVAVAASIGVVLAAGLLVWLMRPGEPFTPGTGGLLQRQPRLGWLVVGALAALAAVAWVVARPTSRISRRRLVGGLAGAGTVAVVGAVALWWPGGIVRDYTPGPPLVPPPQATTPTSARPPATAGTPTTRAAGGTATTAGAPTSAPPATTPTTSP